MNTSNTDSSRQTATSDDVKMKDSTPPLSSTLSGPRGSSSTLNRKSTQHKPKPRQHYNPSRSTSQAPDVNPVTVPQDLTSSESAVLRKLLAQQKRAQQQQLTTNTPSGEDAEDSRPSSSDYIGSYCYFCSQIHTGQCEPKDQVPAYSAALKRKEKEHKEEEEKASLSSAAIGNQENNKFRDYNRITDLPPMARVSFQDIPDYKSRYAYLRTKKMVKQKEFRNRQSRSYPISEAKSIDYIARWRDSYKTGHYQFISQEIDKWVTWKDHETRKIFTLKSDTPLTWEMIKPHGKFTQPIAPGKYDSQKRNSFLRYNKSDFPDLVWDPVLVHYELPGDGDLTAVPESHRMWRYTNEIESAVLKLAESFNWPKQAQPPYRQMGGFTIDDLDDGHPLLNQFNYDVYLEQFQPVRVQELDEFLDAGLQSPLMIWQLNNIWETRTEQQIKNILELNQIFGIFHIQPKAVKSFKTQADRIILTFEQEDKILLDKDTQELFIKTVHATPIYDSNQKEISVSLGLKKNTRRTAKLCIYGWKPSKVKSVRLQQCRDMLVDHISRNHQPYYLAFQNLLESGGFISDLRVARHLNIHPWLNIPAGTFILVVHTIPAQILLTTPFTSTIMDGINPVFITYADEALHEPRYNLCTTCNALNCKKNVCSWQSAVIAITKEALKRTLRVPALTLQQENEISSTFPEICKYCGTHPSYDYCHDFTKMKHCKNCNSLGHLPSEAGKCIYTGAIREDYTIRIYREMAKYPVFHKFFANSDYYPRQSMKYVIPHAYQSTVMKLEASKTGKYLRGTISGPRALRVQNLAELNEIRRKGAPDYTRWENVFDMKWPELPDDLEETYDFTDPSNPYKLPTSPSKDPPHIFQGPKPSKSLFPKNISINPLDNRGPKHQIPSLQHIPLPKSPKSNTEMKIDIPSPTHSSKKPDILIPDTPSDTKVQLDTITEQLKTLTTTLTTLTATVTNAKEESDKQYHQVNMALVSLQRENRQHRSWIKQLGKEVQAQKLRTTHRPTTSSNQPPQRTTPTSSLIDTPNRRRSSQDRPLQQPPKKATKIVNQSFVAAPDNPAADKNPKSSD